MGHFSKRFNNKLYKAHRKALNNTFDTLGNKIKALELGTEKENTILGILDESYTAKHKTLSNQAADGTLPELEKVQEEEETTGTTESTDEDLAEFLGTDANTAKTQTAEVAKPEVTAPAKPAKPAAAAKTASAKKTAAKK